jgi:hypothetical protein
LETYLREGFAVLAVLVVVLGTDGFGVGRSVEYEEGGRTHAKQVGRARPLVNWVGSERAATKTSAKQVALPPLINARNSLDDAGPCFHSFQA